MTDRAIPLLNALTEAVCTALAQCGYPSNRPIAENLSVLMREYEGADLETHPYCASPEEYDAFAPTNDARDLLEKMQEAARGGGEWLTQQQWNAVRNVAVEHFGPERQAKLDRLVAAYERMKAPVVPEPWTDADIQRAKELVYEAENNPDRTWAEIAARAVLRFAGERMEGVRAELAVAHARIAELERAAADVAGRSGGALPVEKLIRVLEVAAGKNGMQLSMTEAVTLAHAVRNAAPAALPVSAELVDRAKGIAERLPSIPTMENFATVDVLLPTARRQALADAATLARDLASRATGAVR
jgi:hypothetical protein